MNRETFYFEINKFFDEKFPLSNWICFTIADEKPSKKLLSEFIRKCVEQDLFEFKSYGKFADYIHNFFDIKIVEMEANEGDIEIETITTGSDDVDLANAFWECYCATSLPNRADYDNVKIVCVNFDKKNYALELSDLIKKFNQGWIPDDTY